MRKSTDIKRRFEYIASKNSVKQIMDSKIVFEMNKEEMENNLANYRSAKKAMRAQRKKLLEEIKDMDKLMAEYKKVLPKFKVDENEKRKADKGRHRAK